MPPRHSGHVTLLCVSLSNGGISALKVRYFQVTWRKGSESPKLSSAEKKHDHVTPPSAPAVPPYSVGSLDLQENVKGTCAGNGVRGLGVSPTGILVGGQGARRTEPGPS